MDPCCPEGERLGKASRTANAAAYRAYRDPPRGSRAAVRAIAAADDAGRAYLAHRRTHGGDA